MKLAHRSRYQDFSLHLTPRRSHITRIRIKSISLLTGRIKRALLRATRHPTERITTKSSQFTLPLLLLLPLLHRRIKRKVEKEEVKKSPLSAGLIIRSRNFASISFQAPRELLYVHTRATLTRPRLRLRLPRGREIFNFCYTYES